MDEKQFEDLTKSVGDVAKRLDDIPDPADWQATQKRVADVETEARRVPVLESDIAELKAMLNYNLGKSGAEDFQDVFGKWIKASWHHKMGKRMPSWLEKSAADYVTDVDAQGGYLAPTLVANEVIKLSEAHGQIFPEVNKVTVPAGASIKFPYESTLPTATWRVGQGGAATEDAGPIAWGADTLRPEFINDYVKIANEAFNAPGINIPQSLAMMMTAKIVRKIEEGIIGGYTGTTTHTGRTAPHNGILRATNVNAQTSLATPTFALVNTFIGECIADHEGSAIEDENYIITTGSVAHRLKSLLTQQGNNWGDVTQGVQSRLMGYHLRTSPHVHRTITDTKRNWIIMAPLKKVTVAWSGSFFVDFNDRGEGWTHNETWLMVGTHADFTLGNPAMHHRAQVTALA